MNRIRKLEVVLDADDVLLDCNAYALSLLKKKDGTGCGYSIDHVTDWGLLGIPEDGRLDFLNSREFYTKQPALPGAAAFLEQLCELADVTIMTAVYPQFMGERIQRLMQLFPFFPMDHIIMGKRKELLQADVMLDDGVHNLLSSGAALPVLFRQPWNRKVSGICCVNCYEEFLSLINIMAGNRLEISRVPKVLCIAGPSGSGKHDLAEALGKEEEFCQIHTYTTCAQSRGNHRISEEQFDAMLSSGCFMEHTYYCGDRYGISAQDIDAALSEGKHAVAVMDISGCMAVYNRYPGQSRILYADRDKRDCILSILNKPSLPVSHQTDRILSIDLEQKNKILADQIICCPSSGDYTEVIGSIRKRIDG